MRKITALILVMLIVLAGCHKSKEPDAPIPNNLPATTSDFTLESYTGEITDIFSEGSGENMSHVLQVKTEEGTVLFSLSATTNYNDLTSIQIGDKVAIESVTMASSPDLHTVLSIKAAE